MKINEQFNNSTITTIFYVFPPKRWSKSYPVKQQRYFTSTFTFNNKMLHKTRFTDIHRESSVSLDEAESRGG